MPPAIEEDKIIDGGIGSASHVTLIELTLALNKKGRLTHLTETTDYRCSQLVSYGMTILCVNTHQVGVVVVRTQLKLLSENIYDCIIEQKSEMLFLSTKTSYQLNYH